MKLPVSHIVVYQGCATFITEGPNAIKQIRPRAAPSFHTGCLVLVTEIKIHFVVLHLARGPQVAHPCRILVQRWPTGRSPSLSWSIAPDFTRYLKRTFFNQYSFLLHFMTFPTCDFINDRSIASYQEIFWSIPVEDKLATPAIVDASTRTTSNR